jgi:DNA-binding IclR family transcriptional regulator
VRIHKGARKREERSWRFLSNHARVLICLAKDATLSMRQIALELEITERAVQRIVNALAAARFLKKIRRGRRNHYEIDNRLPIRHLLALEHEAGVSAAGRTPRKARLKPR